MLACHKLGSPLFPANLAILGLQFAGKTWRISATGSLKTKRQAGLISLLAVRYTRVSVPTVFRQFLRLSLRSCHWRRQFANLAVPSAAPPDQAGHPERESQIVFRERVLAPPKVACTMQFLRLNEKPFYGGFLEGNCQPTQLTFSIRECGPTASSADCDESSQSRGLLRAFSWGLKISHDSLLAHRV